ncbi:hypothetical protein ABTE19_21830, partial [Acinetobacter baumannii]
VLEVPTEKMKAFLQLIMNLGLDKHAIASKQNDDNQLTVKKNFFKRLSSKFLLFDWEYFNNELEFE